MPFLLPPPTFSAAHLNHFRLSEFDKNQNLIFPWCSLSAIRRASWLLQSWAVQTSSKSWRPKKRPLFDPPKKRTFGRIDLAALFFALFSSFLCSNYLSRAELSFYGLGPELRSLVSPWGCVKGREKIARALLFSNWICVTFLLWNVSISLHQSLVNSWNMGFMHRKSSNWTFPGRTRPKTVEKWRDFSLFWRGWTEGGLEKLAPNRSYRS